MNGGEGLRAAAIVFRREYIERVKSRSFVLATLLMPFFVLILAASPALLAVPNLVERKRLVIACGEPRLLRQLDQWLDGSPRFVRYVVELDPVTTAGERARLVARLRAARIDGFLWLDPEALASGHVAYTSRADAGFLEREYLRGALGRVITRERLAAHGLKPGEITRILTPVELETASIPGVGQPRHGGSDTAMLLSVVLISMLEVSLLSYGVIVMRSVLDDKSSRVMEVLLCAATARDLMAGKILGIGAVSLTQMTIWVAMAGVAASLGASFLNLSGVLHLSAVSVICFAALYLLGYLLYSSFYAAVGAAFNSLDEAQQWNFVITLPLLFSGLFAWSLGDRPESTLAVVLSLLPPSAPVIMSMRVAVGQAPAWQLVLSIVLLLVSIYIALLVSSRIYRVGILMYGKKPTIREIARWLRYA
jgi:ABC-2 type transport system permease protein